MKELCVEQESYAHVLRVLVTDHLVKLKNDSPEQSHKCDGIRVRITLRAFPYYSDCTYDSITYDLVKTRLLEPEAA